MKKYKSWNKFERKWFWSNTTLTTLGFYALFFFENFIALLVFEVILIYYANTIYRSLSRQEKEWKGGLDVFNSL